MIPGLVALIQGTTGIDAGMRAVVAPLVLPEGAQRGITYQVVGGSGTQAFDRPGHRRVRVQINFHGETYAEADQARTALQASLDNFTGALNDGSYLRNTHFIQPIDFYDYEPRQYRCAAEYYFDFTVS